MFKSSDITLEKLLNNTCDVEAFLTGKNLLHKCDCGYTVYDPDEVNELIQEEFGDEYCNEIFNWAYDLSDNYGWLFIEKISKISGSYHCQYCSSSELTILNDMIFISKSNSKIPDSNQTVNTKKEKKMIAYIDESYDPDFPRKGTDFCCAAVIIPDRLVGEINEQINEIKKNIYGEKNKIHELKFKKIKKLGINKRRKLLILISELLKKYDELVLIAYYISKEAFYNEQIRSEIAISKNIKKEELEEFKNQIFSDEQINEAVRVSTKEYTENLLWFCSHYIESNSEKGLLIVDSMQPKSDALMKQNFDENYPQIIQPTIFEFNDKIKLFPLTKENIKTSKKIDISFKDSKKIAGLQLADFIAGDIRLFFQENWEVLNIHLDKKILKNEGTLFPDLFYKKKFTSDELKRIFENAKDKKSYFINYHKKMVKNLISFITDNGQMRHFNLSTGEIYDLID